MINDETMQCIAKARQGDDDAFARLVEMYQNPVFYLCYRMLGETQEAEDGAQETFLRAYRSLQKYDAERPFLTWLLAIASHYCIDQIRKRKVQFISVDNDDEDDRAEQEIEDKSPGPEALLREGEERRQVRALLNVLEPTARAAVVLVYWYEYSYEEIALALSLSPSAVKSRLHRARRPLAKTWLAQDAARTAAEKKNVISIVQPKPERKRYEMPAL